MTNLVMDVSSHQPDTLAFFQAAKTAGVKAAIVKLTQGSANGDAYVNPKAKAQLNAAKQAGLYVHTYHYARYNGRQDAINEANWFLKYAKAYGLTADSVLAVDVEDDANTWNATDDTNAFLQTVKDAGYPNIDFYTMASWIWQGRLDPNKLIAKNKWIAAYGRTQPGVDNVGTWQFTSTYNIAGNKVDMSYDFSGFYTNAKVNADSNTVTNTPKPAPVAQPKTWIDELGDKWTAESGKFTTTTPLHLRWGARTSSASIMVLPVGSVVKYDAWSRHNGYVWIRQPRTNGQFAYLACRNAKTNEAYGRFE